MTTTQGPEGDTELSYPASVAMLNGHDLSYVDTGEGSAILFIHGLLGSHENWTHLLDRLGIDRVTLVEH